MLFAQGFKNVSLMGDVFILFSKKRTYVIKYYCLEKIIVV